ncbi:4458_t:CDS:2 [Racocetra fulgida]|uniref:4458_t:CDS:1 n=1 Tax=Racocetra fulgida TaxID=60492 RepID=A0A9N9EQH8_9GLOM|nr:4458_t:CDS:2 [Racocetra fulgida]
MCSAKDPGPPTRLSGSIRPGPDPNFGSDSFFRPDHDLYTVVVVDNRQI